MQRGFSLVELLITIAIIAVVGTVSVTIYNSGRKVEDSRVAAYTYADALKAAAIKSRNMERDTAWGVKVNTATVVLFSGATYATRTTAQDKTFDIPTGLTTTGSTEVVFAKFTAAPSAAMTTTFTNAYGSLTVTINQNGTISY